MKVMRFSGGLMDSFTKPKCWDLTLQKCGMSPINGVGWEFLPFSAIVMLYGAYPLVNTQKAIENGHLVRGFTH